MQYFGYTNNRISMFLTRRALPFLLCLCLLGIGLGCEGSDDAIESDGPPSDETAIDDRDKGAISSRDGTDAGVVPDSSELKVADAADSLKPPVAGEFLITTEKPIISRACNLRNLEPWGRGKVSVSFLNGTAWVNDNR